MRTTALIALCSASMTAAVAPSQAEDLAGGIRLGSAVTPVAAGDVHNDKIVIEAALAPLPNRESGAKPPVPEPGTLAMLIAGLGMIVIAQRRRPHGA